MLKKAIVDIRDLGCPWLLEKCGVFKMKVPAVRSWPDIFIIPTDGVDKKTVKRNMRVSMALLTSIV